jgi:toluene monooxygenase system ferredoxin subunit
VGELFNGIDPVTLEALAKLARREELAAGAVLYKPGDAAEDFFVLESGRIEFKIGRGERSDPAGFMLNRGEVFGWAALLESQPHRIAGARSLEDSVLLRVNGKQAVKLLEADAASGLVVMRRLAALIARFLAAAGAK